MPQAWCGVVRLTHLREAKVQLPRWDAVGAAQVQGVLARDAVQLILGGGCPYLRAQHETAQEWKGRCPARRSCWGLGA